MQIHFIAIVT